MCSVMLGFGKGETGDGWLGWLVSSCSNSERREEKHPPSECASGSALTPS